MSFLNNILNYFKSNPVNTLKEFDSNKTNATKEITYKDNERIKAAIREEDEIDKIGYARSTCKDQLNDLYMQTSPKSKQFNIAKGDDPKTKEIKRVQKAELWEEYHKKQDQIKAIENHAITCAYGEKFFADLSADEDATGWKWNLSGGNDRKDHCEICKQNAGEYKKNNGPKFPAHIGCTCNLLPVYKSILD